MMKRFALPLGLTLSVLATTPVEADWIAFHDPVRLVNSGNPGLDETTTLRDNVTVGRTASLLDFASGASTGATIEITGGSDRDDNTPDHFFDSTPAKSIFSDAEGDIIDPRNFIYLGGGNAELIVSGLDPNELYDLVIHMNRGNISGRSTAYTIGDVDSFLNASSAGTTAMGATITLNAGQNNAGDYVRYTNISPGDNGEIRVFATGAEGNSFAYGFDAIRVMQLTGDPIPEPASLALVAIGATLLIRRRR